MKPAIFVPNEIGTIFFDIPTADRVLGPHLSAESTEEFCTISHPQMYLEIN